MQRIRFITGTLILLGILHSCSVKKYIPEDESLYRGATISLLDSVDSSDKTDLQEALEDVLFPEPNSKFLGMYPGLHFYYKAQEEHPGFITKFLNKKMGEEPVYLSDVEIESTRDLLDNRLENNGFFYGEVSSKVKKDSVKKTAKIDYTVSIAKPYRQASFSIEKDSAAALPIYDTIQNAMAETLLKKGQRFNLKTFKDERNRLDEYLKDQGYYYFNGDFVLFEADTNQYEDKRYDLYLKLKEGVPQKALVPYVLDRVEVYSDITEDTTAIDHETIRIDSVDFLQGKHVFKPKRLRPFILLKPGQLYNPETSRFTSRRLASIGTYKFVNIEYKETDSVADSLGRRHLKSVISLSPLPRNSIQFKMQGVTKSNDFTGPGLGVTYTNRNIFKGGENFSVNGTFGYEKQFYKGEKIGASSLHLGLNASLLFPRLLFPGTYATAFRYAIPKTKISAGIDYLRRSRLYTLHSFSTSFGYIWEQNRFVRHEFNPIKIDYVKLSHTSSRFNDILDQNPFLRRSFEQQFIAGSTYSFTYNELAEDDKRGRLYFQFNLDVAGDFINMFGETHEDGVKTFIGLKYAQYAKADIDVSYHLGLGHSRKSSLVGHIFAGWGIPHGNSKSLPFVKQYFSGGPYSVRAFQIRSLGPGTYVPGPDEFSYFDRAGDIRLEANLEYRFSIISVLKGALVADAGNVWLQNKNDALPGGKFTTDFINEFGIGTGFGLRVDIQSFVIRFDLAAKLKRPAKEWNFEYKKPVFNFAIGYPF